MGGAGPLTTSLSSGSGARSNGSTFSCGNIALWESCARVWESFLIITISAAGIRRLPISRRRRYMNDDQENGKERDETGNRASFSFSKFIVKKRPFLVGTMGSTSINIAH